MSQWIKTKLGEIVILNYGKALKAQDRNAGSIPVYSSGGLTGWHNKALINEQGIIIGRKGTVGKAYLTYGPFWCIDTAYYILPNPSKYDFVFLFYLLKTLGLEELNEDSAVPGLNRDTAYSQEILLPSLPEQKAIASVLSSLDDKIDLLHRQNKTLESMAETLFRQWVIEEAQEDWEQAKLCDIASVQNGFAFSSKDYVTDSGNMLEVLKMGHIDKNCSLKLNPKKDFVLRNDKLNKYILEQDDIVLAMTDMKDNVVILGIPALVDKSDHYVLNQRVARIKLTSSKLLSQFLLFSQLKDSEFIDLLRSTASSGVQVNLTTQAIKDSKIIIPSIETQNKILDILTPIYNKLNYNRILIRSAEKLRDTLLPKLMSSEIRVRYAEEKIESVA